MTSRHLQQMGIGALGAIACYNVDSDDTDDEDMDEEEDHIALASQIIDTILNKVTGGEIKLEIKEEPLDIKQEPVEYENIVVTPSMGCHWMTDTVGYRDPTTIKIEDDTEDSESDSESSSDSSDDDKEVSAPKPLEEEPKPSTESVKSKNELGLGDLPKIEDLNITVPEEDCVKIGTIASCVQELVVIESLPGNPALDLDTVLFLDFGKRTLGHIFDVIGPVNQPIYCVRFNSAEHILEKTVSPGMSVFYAPKTEHTAYVFLEQLMKMKISDASWANDEEPPPNFLDYSDDEQERKAKQELKLERMKNAGATEDEVAAKRARFTKGRNKNEAVGDRLPGAVGTDRPDQGHRNSNRGQSAPRNTNPRAGDGGNARQGNGLYGQNNNPFYRRERTYDPKANGPIQWDSVLPAQVPQRSNFSTPPPQYSNITPTHQPPFGAPAAYPQQPQMYGQPSMYQNHNKNQWQQRPQQNQWQQPQTSQQNQWQQPQPQSQQQWQPQQQTNQQSQFQQLTPALSQKYSSKQTTQQSQFQQQWQQPQASQQSHWKQSQSQQQPQATQQSQWQQNQYQQQPQNQQQPDWPQRNFLTPPPPPPGT